MSSVITIYCGHSFSSEFTCVMPAEAHTVPKPVMPFSFAPQGTASIFSNKALSGCFFFFSSALRGTAETRTRAKMSAVLTFITPPWTYHPTLAFGRARPPSKNKLSGYSDLLLRFGIGRRGLSLCGPTIVATELLGRLYKSRWIRHQLLLYVRIGLQVVPKLRMVFHIFLVLDQ